MRGFPRFGEGREEFAGMRDVAAFGGDNVWDFGGVDVAFGGGGSCEYMIGVGFGFETDDRIEVGPGVSFGVVVYLGRSAIFMCGTGPQSGRGSCIMTVGVAIISVVMEGRAGSS